MSEEIGFIRRDQVTKTCSVCGKEKSLDANFCGHCGNSFRKKPKVGFISSPGEKTDLLGVVSEVNNSGLTDESDIGFLADIPDIKFLAGIKNINDLNNRKDELVSKITEHFLGAIKNKPQERDRLREAHRRQIVQLTKEYNFLLTKLINKGEDDQFIDEDIE